MKLVFCKSCEDVIRLQKETRLCKCGESKGRYLSDLVHAIYSGENAIPLGFANSTLSEAIDNQPPNEGMGEDFVAFVIPKKDKWLQKVDDVDKFANLFAS